MTPADVVCIYLFGVACGAAFVWAITAPVED